MSFAGITIMRHNFFNYGPDCDYFVMCIGTIGYTLIDLGK